jgi:hypothetical protein
MKRFVIFAALCALLPASAHAYPLDGYDYTDIARLLAYDRAREGLLARGTLVPGDLKTMGQVKLTLADQPGFEVPASDAGLSGEIREFLGSSASAYGVAVLDLTDPVHPRYAALSAMRAQQPASLGKMAVALAFFDALAEVYPTDIEARHRILRETQITANEYIIKDETHKVPMFNPGDQRLQFRLIEIGDVANIYTYMDWMISRSANAAAAMIQYHLILLKHFGREYPVSEERAAAYFKNSSGAELQRVYANAIRTGLKGNGLNPELFRQGSFFSKTGRSRIPSIGSTATAHELMRYLVLMEQGKLVDPWSSLELKRLLYLTDRRIRYAAAPILNDSAVYYKSGSMYKCKPEAGFACDKFLGNRENIMNSVAIIETDRPGLPPLRYLVVVLSNVLKKDSAEVHAAFATDIQRVIESSHGGAQP